MSEEKQSKSVRAHFVDLIRDNDITPDDMKKFRQISGLVSAARARRAVECPIATDKCISDDCGYDEGGCGNDECCNWCESCMVMSDTCASDECGVAD